MQASPPAVIGQRVGAAAGPPNGVVVAQVVRAAPVQPQPDSTYRLNHKKLHVTMAALEVNEVSNEQVLAMAQMRGTLIEYSIGDELHPEPADPPRPRHKHFYLRVAVQSAHPAPRCTLLPAL